MDYPFLRNFTLSYFKKEFENLSQFQGSLDVASLLHIWTTDVGAPTIEEGTQCGRPKLAQWQEITVCD